MSPRVVLPWLLVTLAACDAAGLQGGPFIRDVPEQVAALAAPNQDLSAVRLMPEDGCYWYRHKGPVETTLLPLRSKDGSPICVSVTPEEEAAETS